MWVDQRREFYNNQWLETDYILMCSTHNEGKSVVPEWFMKTLKGKYYKKLTADDTKSYHSFLNKLVDQYNNTYHNSVSQFGW